MSGCSYLTCRQCCNATIAVANKFGLLGHTRTRSSLCYLLFFGISRGFSTLVVVSINYLCFFEQTVSYVCSLPRTNEKSFSYCK